MSSIVTLLTDYGAGDSYVAEVKGVILTAVPDATLIDVTHQVSPGDVRAGQFLFNRAWRRFPAGTVHLVVVDPGVGTSRRALAAEAHGHFFVAPDNGLLTSLPEDADFVSLPVPPSASPTFHGRDVFAVPGNVTNKNAWGPNTLIKQGAKLTATWEDVWEELSSDVKLQIERHYGSPESKPDSTASLFSEPPVPAHARAVLDRLKRDEATQLDDLMDALEGRLGSAEIFTALFELELRGRIRQMPGKNYVRCF